MKAVAKLGLAITIFSIFASQRALAGAVEIVGRWELERRCRGDERLDEVLEEFKFRLGEYRKARASGESATQIAQIKDAAEFSFSHALFVAWRDSRIVSPAFRTKALPNVYLMGKPGLFLVLDVILGGIAAESFYWENLAKLARAMKARPTDYYRESAQNYGEYRYAIRFLVDGDRPASGPATVVVAEASYYQLIFADGVSLIDICVGIAETWLDRLADQSI